MPTSSVCQQHQQWPRQMATVPSAIQIPSATHNELQNKNDTINQMTPSSCRPKDIVGDKCKGGQNNKHETQKECTEVIELLNGNRKRDNTAPNNKEQHRCNKFTLQRHVAKKHPNLIDSYSKGNCVCQCCGFKSHMMPHPGSQALSGLRVKFGKTLTISLSFTI